MDKHYGVGVMLNMLGGNRETYNAYHACLNKRIIDIDIVKDKDYLYIEFDDNTKLKIFDDGQSCCEIRYMNTDDDLKYHVGSIFIGAEIKNGPDEEDEYGIHETQFLEIKTSKGCFTITNHNEHNGYYGGFAIELRLM